MRQCTELRGLLVLLLCALSLSSNYYCALFETDEVSGYFQFEHTGKGYAKYTFAVDLSNYNASTCDFSSGIEYHIHTTWTNSSTNSSSGGVYCGAKYTGGHYDPNLACGSKSEYANTKCPLISRDDDTVYTYACTSDAYSAGQYALCEVGDLAGKFGVVYEESDGTAYFNQSVALEDYTPPYEYNFETSDSVSGQWASVVIHCAADGSRIACGKLSMQSDETCPQSDVVTSDDDNDDAVLSDEDIALIVMGVVLVFILILLIVFIFLYYQRPWDTRNQYAPLGSTP